MSDKRISQLVERVTIANNDVLPIVALNAATTNKVTISTIQDWMQTNLNMGVTSVAITLPTGLSVTGSPITSTGTFAISFTAGYSIPTTAKQTEWDTAYTNRITSATAPLGIASNVISITQSGAASDGYLSSTDWNTFNNKQSTITTGNLTEATSSVLTITGGTGAVLGSGTSIQVKQASGSQDGFLDSADWTTFNDKQNALSGTGIVKSTGGTISYLTDNTSNWDSAYNDKINSAAVTGTTTKTLTLTQQDGGTITTTWTDLDTGTVTSVGVSMPSAFSVANSPITSSGTIAITGAGTISQYIDGTGTLRTFPTIIAETTRLVREVYNNSGTTMTKGTVVYINGGQGNLPTIARALATGDATSAQTYGVVQTSIGNMSNGYIVVVGDLIDMDTQAFVEGTQLYLSPTTAGEYTSTKPYAPQHLVYVGIVTRSHPTQGIIAIKIQNGFEMDELHNVSAQNPNNNDILQYKTATNLWTKVAGSTTNIEEGTRLYYTDARARAAFSESVTGLDYNSTTGVLSTTTGYGIPTAASQTNWDAAYNDKINSAAVTGTTTKTLTLNQQDGGTITASWTDINTDAVSSVFGRTGAVVATNGDYNTDQVTEGTSSLYFTNARSRSSITLTTTGTSGAATYNSTTGVLNIPQYQGGVTSFNTRTGAITLTSGDVTTALGFTPADDSLVVHKAGTETITGKKTFSNAFGDGDPLLVLTGTGSGPFQYLTTAYSTNLSAGQTVAHFIGRASSSRMSAYIGYQYAAADSNSNFLSLGHWGYDHLIKLYPTGQTVISGNISAANLSGTNTGDQTLSGLGGVPTSRTLTINGTAYDLSADRSWTISTGGLSAGFTTYGTLYARAAMTTYSGHSTTAPDDAPIKSLSGSEDNWIYLDAAVSTWGIYHRQIDSTLSVASQKDLPANSIAFIGGGNLSSYISMQTGEIWSKALSVGIVSNTGTASATPSLIQMDSIYGNNAAGKNFKLKLFQQGNSTSYDYGLGISDSNFELTAGSGASFNFYINATTPSRVFNLGGSSATFYVPISGSTFTMTGGTINGVLFINNNTTGLVFKRDAVTNYCGTYYRTVDSNYWFIGMRENLSSNNHIHYSEITAKDVLTLNVSDNTAKFYDNLSIGNQANIYGGLAGLYALQNGNSSYYSYDQEVGLVGNAYYSSGWKYKTTNLATRYLQNTGTHVWHSVASGTAGAALTWIERMRINSGSGALLLGTDTESASLSGNTLTIRASTSNVGQTAISIQDYNKVGRWAINGQTGASVYDFTIYNAPTGAGDWTPRFTITEAGFIGVGITPQVKFHVNGTSYIGKMSAYAPAVHIRGGYYGGPRLQLYGLDADPNAWMGLGTDMDGSAYTMSLYYPTNASSAIVFGKYDGTATQFGGFTATARLSNNGTWTVAADVIAYGSPSDISLKENIKPIEDALEKILQLEGVSFDWRAGTDSNSLTGIKEDLGFIAQQVQGVIPKLVRQNDNGKLSLRDKGIIPYLVEAIKEQQKQIEELKKQVA